MCSFYFSAFNGKLSDQSVLKMKRRIWRVLANNFFHIFRFSMWTKLEPRNNAVDQYSFVLNKNFFLPERHDEVTQFLITRYNIVYVQTKSRITIFGLCTMHLLSRLRQRKIKCITTDNIMFILMIRWQREWNTKVKILLWNNGIWWEVWKVCRMKI